MIFFYFQIPEKVRPHSSNSIENAWKGNLTPHFSQSTREKATSFSGTSPVAKYYVIGSAHLPQGTS